MTEKRSGRNGDNFMWTLTLGLFALGAVSLFLSFGDDGGSRVASAGLDSDALEAASVQSEAMGDIEPDVEGDGAVPGQADGTGEPAADRFTISASGDILIHERVAEAAQTGDTTYDFTPLFAPVQNLIASRDFAICHLEVPLSSNNEDLSFDGVFRAPMELADALVGAGFDTCSLASNHSWDSGEASVISTVEQLQRVSLSHVGIANTPEQAAQAWQFNVLGNIVGHMSYTFGLNGRAPGEVPQDRVNQIDEAQIFAEAARQRALGSEFIILSMHWGTEFQNEIDEFQADLGPRLLASPDIDLILGHHAHVPQEVVEINGEYIAYGLGNLLSNQAQGIPECPTACPLDSQDGVLLDFVVERNDGVLRVTEVIANPTWVDNRNTWQVIPTDSPPTIGEFDLALLAESGARTRTSLGLG